MNVNLPPNTPVDLYAATGITVGARLKVNNLSTGDVRLSISEAGLLNNHIPLGPYECATNETGDTGAWALTVGGGGLNVREA
jgi:hypothetical protein